METFQSLLAREVDKEIRPVILAMGFTPVEVNVGRTKNQSLVSLVIYRKQGVSIDDCAAVSRNIHPRLELIPDLGNFSLEVSSPGIGRIFKSREEYDIFQGRAVSVLTVDNSEWIDGIIERADQDRVYLNRNGEVMDIRFDLIKKARLEFSQQEGR